MSRNRAALSNIDGRAFVASLSHNVLRYVGRQAKYLIIWRIIFTNTTTKTVVHDHCSLISRVDIGTIDSQQDGFYHKQIRYCPVVQHMPLYVLIQID